MALHFSSHRPDNLLLTADEAAALIGAPKQTVYRLIRKNQIPWVRLGAKMVRVPRDALQRWITAQTHAVMPSQE